jgi:hypothetical protein
MFSWWGIILQAEVNQYHSNGLGNGDHRRLWKIRVEDGGIIAVYVD